MEKGGHRWVLFSQLLKSSPSSRPMTVLAAAYLSVFMATVPKGDQKCHSYTIPGPKQSPSLALRGFCRDLHFCLSVSSNRVVSFLVSFPIQ